MKCGRSPSTDAERAAQALLAPALLTGLTGLTGSGYVLYRQWKLPVANGD